MSKVTGKKYQSRHENLVTLSLCPSRYSPSILSIALVAAYYRDNLSYGAVILVAL